MFFLFLFPALFLILLLLLPLLARDCLVVRSCKLGDVDGVCDLIAMHSKLWIGGSHLLVFGLKTVPAAHVASRGAVPIFIIIIISVVIIIITIRISIII